MSHSTHSSAPPAQGNAGAQQTDAPPATSAVIINSASQHVQQHSVQQPAAPGETDNIQPEVEAIEDSSTPDDGESDQEEGTQTQWKAAGDDLEKGVPGVAAGSSNATMDDEFGTAAAVAQGAAPSGANNQTGDADMEFVAGSSLPPIDDAKRKHKDKAEQRAAKERLECEQFKAMTLDQKKKALDNYNSLDHYTKGSYVDAQDTTNVFIMAKIIEVDTNYTDLTVSYDGWPDKWNMNFRKRSNKVAPFRSWHHGYSGQNKVAIRYSQEAISLDEVQFHINIIEGYISSDFEGKSAHNMTQYICGHLFTFIDTIMGVIYHHSPELETQEAIQPNNMHPFEYSLIHKLFRTYLRFVTCYFRKLSTLGKSIQETNQVPRLFLVDPQAAILNMHHEIAETLMRIFAAEGRTIKQYIMKDLPQLPRQEIKRIVDQTNEAIVPNSFGEVVKDYTQVDFILRRHQSGQEYPVEQIIQRTNQKHEIVFGSLSNYVQYFAEIGGFDAMLACFKMGCQEGQTPVPVSKEQSSGGKSAQGADITTVKLPFRIINSFLFAFSHLKQTLTDEFSQKLTIALKEQIQARLDIMTERDLKEVDKDEIANLINNMSEFLQLSESIKESFSFIEHTQLQFALRFLKSENLEKRLKGLQDIRYMCERAIERYRFENWRNRTGKTIHHWNNLVENKDKPYPSEVIRINDLKNWIITNQVLQIILGPNAHIEIVKRSGQILRLLCRYGNDKFDESIVDLIWKCQLGKHEEVVRTVYNLIQEVIPFVTLDIVNCFFEKIKQYPPPAIDEKYINFMRECTLIAFKRYKICNREQFYQENQSTEETEIKQFRSVQDSENSVIAGLTMQNIGEISAQLQAKNMDYGLSLFWQVCQDHEPGSGLTPLSNELFELTISSLQQIFIDSACRHARCQFLIKAIQNICNFKSMVQSIHVLDPIMRKIQDDQIENDRWRFDEEENAPPTKPLVQTLEESVNIIEKLVNNIEAYHGEVKQKCKQLYKNGGSVPEKIEEQVFYGRYNHQQTLEKSLEFIEFIICQAQKAVDVDSGQMLVTLGIENIKRLWVLFVKEPNFQSDQTLFLNWINKQRTHTTIQIVYNQKKTYQYELYIFSEQEKRFLFESFLCNPDEVNAAQISVALVKCFQKYFKLINISNQAIQRQRNNNIKVISFDKKLVGMDALWKMALFSQNEKAKEISQEFLVTLHLRFDNQTATRQHKQSVINSFVTRCMEILSQSAPSSEENLAGTAGAAAGSSSSMMIQTTQDPPAASVNDLKSVMQLLALFLDRYEGIRVLKAEQSFARLTNIKPHEIDVINNLDLENRYAQRVHISYFQTLGHLRAKIAKEFGIQINEFTLHIKQATVDPDVDDDTYIKDINNVPTKCSIKRNPNYERDMHPKYQLAKNQQNFQIIFSMLQSGAPQLCEPVWTLIQKLPKNESVIDGLRTLTFIKDVMQQPTAAASGVDLAKAQAAAWSTLLDPQAIFKLLYCLQIMQTEFMNVAFPQRDEELYEEEMNQEQFNQQLQAYEQQREWKQQFIQLGGFTHLLQSIVQLNLPEIRSNLELKVIRGLIQSITKFINHANEIQQLQELENRQQNTATNAAPSKSLMQQQTADVRHACVLKVIQLIDAICKYSLEQESARGESYETIQKRIEQAKLKKQRQRIMALGNKVEKQKATQDEDDGDSDDKKVLQGINSGFKEQADIVLQLFNLINVINAIDPETPTVIVNYPGLAQMLERGMMLSENRYLRDNMSKRIQNILINLHKSAHQPQPSQIETAGAAPSSSAALPSPVESTTNSIMPFKKIMEILLTSISEKSKHLKNESRCTEVIEQVCFVLGVLEPQDLEVLQNQILGLIEQLPRDIQERPTKEIGSSDTDLLLGGYMNILNNLLRRFPQFKKPVGSMLTQYLIHDCLFEIPHGDKNAPKCKSYLNRDKTFGLLQTLTTDCIDNLNTVLVYIKRFNENPSWRTNKESDWNLKLYDDEKSTTGHVGIKNLGCICYMNSLHQQLFMIPGFRNDILSVKDPNHNNDSDEDNMFLQWQTLFAGLLLSQKMYVNPKAYCHAFKDWEGQPVNVFEQMDVEEYFNMFMDRLEAAIKGTPQEKTIQYHFGGKLANEIICKTCPHMYTRDEAFLSVGVPVKNKKSFQEGMEAFIAGDLLDQGNQYYCEKCDKKVDALKRTCLQTMPRYMITALKRFDFDLDIMMRKKLNDYFEFQVEIDMREYTQEYLNQKEKLEKDKLESKKSQTRGDDDDEAMEEITMTNPAEYYQFDLVGVIVHAGTADSGHYYSYIKEQETFRLDPDGGKEKWYEFNDSYVRDWDVSEIPAETFGGEEPSYNNGFGMSNQKIMRMRNAYVLIYKRKLTDESLIVSDDAQPAAEGSNSNENQQVAEAAAEGEAQPEEPYKLGAQTLQLAADSRLNKKIQWDNHRYWHIRYLFKQDYQSFVTRTLQYWNTTYIIPQKIHWRNQDFHLLDPKFANFQVEQRTTLEVPSPTDVSLDLSTMYDQDAIQDAKFNVFKFAVQFYYTIQQRSQQKYGLPDMSRYLKTYINEDLRCARWFINEFINCELLEEIMMQNCQKIMRRVYIGIVTCAMLKVFEDEKDRLNDYWDDVENQVENPRQTTLGNYVNTLLFLLPKLKHFSANQVQFLQLISQFCRMGIESKRYLIRADAVQRLLNYFYYQDTPFRDDFINAPRLPFELNEEPEMGLPTPEDPQAKKSQIVIKKEEERLGKLVTSNPSYMYLIETISSLVRCMSVPLPQNYVPMADQPVTPYVIQDLGYRLSKDNMVLWMPDTVFVVKLFEAARKSRAAVALSKAYVHYDFNNEKFAQNLFQVVCQGLERFDYDKVRPFLILFQHMLESSVLPNARLFSEFAPQWLQIFFMKIVRENVTFYCWMEIVTDWVIKVACRLEFVRTWMQNNPNIWEFMIEWFKQNPEVPMQQYQDRSSMVRLYKPKNQSRGSQYRFANQYRNKGANFMRRNELVQIKMGQAPDLSHEIDIDYYHLDDFKLQKEQRVFILEDRHMNIFVPATIATDMDELCYVRYDSKDFNHNWMATDKGNIFIEGIWDTSHKCQELDKIEDIFRRQAKQQAKAQLEAQRQQRGGLPRGVVDSHHQEGAAAEIEDDMDIDENNGTLEDNAADGVVRQDIINEDMLDETEHNERGAV